MRPAAVPVVLVVAKSPEPGFAKTRLVPEVTPEHAASIAASSLLDTLRVARRTPGVDVAVAWTGELARAVRCDEVTAELEQVTVFPQRGEGFAARLAEAHGEVARRWPGRPVLQIGMDTPQVTTDLLIEAGERLSGDGTTAVLGPAEDGGWWLLGLRDPRQASVLAGVPMSRADTGVRTLVALHDAGLHVLRLPCLTDVDTVADATHVAALVPRSEFAQAVRDAVGTPR